MKTLSYGLMALSIGCLPKKGEVSSQQEQQVVQEPRARRIATFLHQTGVEYNNFFFQRYTNKVNGEKSLITACYVGIDPQTEQEFANALVISFSNQQFILIDRGADDSLDDIVMFADVPVSVPIERFSAKDQRDHRKNYANVLEELYVATFEEEKTN